MATKAASGIQDPVTAAMAKVIRASKRARDLQSTMTPVVLREMDIGADPKNDMFDTPSPSFFAGQLGLTHKAEMRKLKKISVEHQVEAVPYDIHYSSIPNEVDPTSGLFFPDMLGRKMHASEPAMRVHVIFRCEDDGSKYKYKTTNMKDVVKAEISNEHTHKFLSLILKKENLFKEFFVKREIFDEDKVAVLLTLAKQQCLFRHETLPMDTISTADYTIHICSTRHFYTAVNNEYGFEVHKKIVFATVRGGGQHIPICEEMVIQHKSSDTSSRADTPTLVNDKKCIVISCSICAVVDTYNQAYFHFFGDNAFTIGYKTATKHIPTDKTKLCTRLAGSILKKMININSADIEKVAGSVNFFKDMFDFEKYKPLNNSENDVKNENELAGILKLRAEPVQDAAYVQSIVGQTKNSEGKDKEEIIKETVLTERTLASFLKRQNVRSLMAVDEGKCCNTVKWISSPSFSILSLSPHGMPHINCVFILTYSAKESNNPGDSTGKKYTHIAAKFATADCPARVPLAVSFENSRRSMLTPDLEEELSGIF